MCPSLIGATCFGRSIELAECFDEGLHAPGGFGRQCLLSIGYLGETPAGDSAGYAAGGSQDGTYLDQDVEGVTLLGDHFLDATDLALDALEPVDYALDGVLGGLLHSSPPVKMRCEAGAQEGRTAASGQELRGH